MTALLYTLFALVAMAVNIGSQELSLFVYDGPYAIYPAIFAGTLAGLVCKYLLDKHYIFTVGKLAAGKNLQTFILYTGTGVLTTLLFWGTELGFELAFGTRSARYIGAIIGLSLGYVLKYQLDRRYVFNSGVGG